MTHGVGEYAAETDRALAATPGLVGEPTDAERARTLFAVTTHAALATIARDPVGHPFGSLVGHAIDATGRPVLCLSDLAEHTANLATDSRASLMATATAAPGADPLAGARATLVGELREVPDAEREPVLAAYRAVHPAAFYSGFADFRPYRLEVAAVRYVGGFGRMSWVATGDYADAEPDPLRTHVTRIVEHMNDDHADALVAFCRVLAGRPETVSARMVGVDRYGFDVLATTDDPGGTRAVRLGFDGPTDTPDAVRAAMIDLVRRTR